VATRGVHAHHPDSFWHAVFAFFAKTMTKAADL